MRNTTMPPIHHPHDALFKTMFRTPEVAKDFLKKRLEPHIFNTLDLTTFKLENSSFIDDRLKASHSDLVVSIQCKQGQETCYVYFLIEHQTKHEDNMMMRVWEYNTKLMRQHINQGGKKFPVIFNFVFYTDSKPYTEAKSMLASFESQTLFYDAIKRNVVIELAKEEDSKLAKDDKAALVQLLLKHEKERDFCRLLESKHLQVAKLINTTPHALTVFLYMLDREKHEPETLLAKLNNLTPTKRDEIMTGLQRLRNQDIKEGIKLGKQEGAKQEKIQIARGMLSKGLDIKLIQELTGLSTKEIQSLTTNCNLTLA